MNIGARRKEIELADEVLDPRALTIGFARRFATYKRAGLLLKDKETFAQAYFRFQTSCAVYFCR